MGVLIFLYIGLMDEKTALERIVTSHKHEKAVIQKEKDSLMAQLAIAESKLKISMEGNKTTDPAAQVKHVQKPIETVESINTKVTKIPVKKVPYEKKADKPVLNLKTELARISVDNLLVCYDPYTGRMHVEFKVINIGEKKQPVSGYAYAILKDGKEEKDGWLIFPETRLSDGMPVQNRGMRFRIYNFRTMKFSVKQDNPDKYTYATIFVYQQDTGKLMLERDFEITTVSNCP
jgi:hypothetical protein